MGGQENIDAKLPPAHPPSTPLTHHGEVVCHLIHEWTIHDLQHSDIGRVCEVGQQLGGEQKALGGVFIGCRFHQLLKCLALIDRIHALIDLIHYTKWHLGDTLLVFVVVVAVMVVVWGKVGVCTTNPTHLQGDEVEDG